MKRLTTLVVAMLLLFNTVQAQTLLYPLSPLRIEIPSNATYTQEFRIGTFRNTYTDYSGNPPCIVPVGTTLPTVRITVDSSGRVENWQIPTTCNPDTGSDHHLIVVNENTGFVYEFWLFRWNSGRTSARVGGAVPYAINGNGITTNPNRRTTAAGISDAAGQIRAADMSACDTAITHGLAIALPTWAISTAFIPPAVGGETAGRAPTSTGIPMGALFALPRDLDIESIPNLSPFTRTALRAAQTYGLMVDDGNSAANYLGRANGSNYAATATFHIEPGVLTSFCGVSNDDFLQVVGREVGAVIAQYGLFRVTYSSSGTTTPATIAPSATRTAVGLPTVTRTPTRTPTVIPGSSATPTPRALTCLLFWDFRMICNP